LKGGSSASGFLIWDPPNKETPPWEIFLRSNWGGYRGPEVLVKKKDKYEEILIQFEKVGTKSENNQQKGNHFGFKISLINTLKFKKKISTNWIE